MKFLLVVLNIISLMLFVNAQVVQTQFGQIGGSMNGGVYEFLGIPFAKPPVGPLRWQSPQNPKTWEGIINTTEFAPVCPQKSFVQGDTTYTMEGDEDCLYLNIWTPELVNSNLPVMVFIHGGGNQQGGASQVSGGAEMYSGKNLAERGDAVIVTIQYRLGPLGFLVHPGLETENPDGISGNYAVLDQILALNWVQNNISNFGGAPNKVMIFGESAGGVNVGNLLTTDLAKGLFQRACIQSAAPVINTYSDARNKGIEFVGKYITTGSEIEKMAYMRSLPFESVVQFATSPIIGGIVQQNWQPVIDNVIFKDFPKQAFQNGNFNKVPLIIGSNADEMSLSSPKTVLPAMVNALIKSTIPVEFQSTAFELYPPGSNSAEARESFVGILTDAQFTVNVRRTAQCISMNQTEPVWRYFFTHRHTIPQLATYGSYHGMELFYVFNNWENTALGSGFFFKTEDEAVQNSMLKYWINFAESGNPNGEQLENWPRYESPEDSYLEINSVLNGNQTGLRTAQSNLWDNISGFTGCSSSVFSEDITDNMVIHVYPNPSDGIFRFVLPVRDNFKIEVYNSTGQKIVVRPNAYAVDLNNQPNGIYFYEVKTGTQLFKGKIVKRD